MRFTPREFRNALGRFATGVCVITINPPGQKPFGMTVNSFASVSLDPPLLLWSLQKNSDCFAAFEHAQQFSVNVLTAGQEAISNQYAKKNEHELLDGTYKVGRSGCVVLKDVMTSFECNLETIHDGGDHIIIIGRVLEVNNHPAHREPLVFYSGKYRALK